MSTIWYNVRKHIHVYQPNYVKREGVRWALLGISVVAPVSLVNELEFIPLLLCYWATVRVITEPGRYSKSSMYVDV